MRAFLFYSVIASEARQSNASSFHECACGFYAAHPVPCLSGSLCSFKFDPVKFVTPSGVLVFCYSPKEYPRLNPPGANLNSCLIAGPKGKTQDVFCNCRPTTSCPRKNIGVTSAPNFANGSVGSAVRADQPQFAVHGELTLPKSKAEAGVRGEGRSKSQKNQKGRSDYFLTNS